LNVPSYTIEIYTHNGSNIMTKASLSDDDLMRLLIKEDRKAFEILYRRYVKIAYYKAQKITYDQVQANDIVQDAFTKLWLTSGDYDPQSKFSSYLNKIIYNFSVNYQKRNKLVTNQEETLRTESNFRETISEILYKQDMLHEIFDQISEEDRKLLTCKYLKNMSYSQIAEMVGKNKRTIRNRIFYLKKMLRKKFKEL